MKAAIMENGKVFGEITVDSKVRRIWACMGFSIVRKVKETAHVNHKGFGFETPVNVSADATYEEIKEAPVRTHLLYLSYAKKNVEKAKTTGVWASKVKCLEYPDGYYQIFFADC